VWSSFHRVTRIDGPVPIGHPVANTQIHVVDGKLRTLPVGVIGEIFIGGDGVTQGYLARPELTAERFLPDPHRAAVDGRWYKTGDLGRWRADGVLECLGRIDHQVKLRGYRIELGEIEANLAMHESVARTIVITREDQPGDVRLVAYVVPKGELKAEVLRNHLGRNLPDYMIPQHFIALQSVPLLPNGKLDRRALPKPDIKSLNGGRTRVAPRTPLEKQVLEAMETVLNLPGLGITDNFFALGGHSLLAAKLTSSLNRDLELNLPLRTVFESPNVAALSAAIEAARNSIAPKRASVARVANQASAPLTVMQERIRFVEEMFPGRVTYNTPSAHRLRGKLDFDAFERAFNEVVRRQPGLRTRIAKHGEGWVQEVTPSLMVRLPQEDLSGVPAADREGELMKRIRALVDKPLDIYTAPLFRVALFRMDHDSHVLFFMPHHIIWDGWSFDLFYQEMAAAYAGALRAQPSSLPPLAVTYVDYAHWHAAWMKGEEFQAQLAYWKKRFSNIGTPRALPTDLPRRPGMTGAGAVEWVHIDKALASQLHELARRADATLNMLAMALYSAMLSEAVGSQLVIVGMPVRGRLMNEVEPIMGFFNNMLPIPLRVDASLPFAEWVRTVKRELVDTFANQDVPFERLASEPEFSAYSQKAGFYQGLFSFQDARERQRDWGGLQQENLPVMQGGATEDFGLWLMEGSAGLTGGINFNADLFTRETAVLFRRRLLGLLRDLVARPDSSVSDLLAAPSEEQRLFRSWLDARGTSAPAPVVAPAAEAATAKSAAESVLAEIWSQLLGLDATQIAPGDNFFDVGGSSLLAMQAVNEMERRMGVKIDPRRYVYESLRQLASAGAAAPAGGSDAVDHTGLAAIWADLLGLDASQIQPTDNFFDLGGSSLLAMRAVAEGDQKLGLKIDPRRYVYESLRQLAVPAAAVTPAAESPAAKPAQPKSRLFGLFGRGKS
jgi:acyl carrier protein